MLTPANHSYYSQIYNDLVFTTLKNRLGEHKAAVFARSATAGGQRFPVHVSSDPTRSCQRQLTSDARSGEVIASPRTKPWPNRSEEVSV